MTTYTIAKPKNELSWHDCTSKEFSQAAAPAPAGVKLDCANYDADLDMIAEVRNVWQFFRDRRPDSYEPIVAQTGKAVGGSY